MSLTDPIGDKNILIVSFFSKLSSLTKYNQFNWVITVKTAPENKTIAVAKRLFFIRSNIINYEFVNIINAK